MILLTKWPRHYIGRCYIMAVLHLFFGWLIWLPFCWLPNCVFIIGDWSCLFALEEIVPIWKSTHPSCCSWWFIYWMAVAHFSWSTRVGRCMFAMFACSCNFCQCVTMLFCEQKPPVVICILRFLSVFQLFILVIIIYYVPYVHLWSELGLYCAIVKPQSESKSALWSHWGHLGHVALS